MAVGAPLGQSITKALYMSRLPAAVHVADISDRAAGFYITSAKAIVLPMVKHPDYLESLTRYIRENAINVVFPVISPEHEFFSAHKQHFSDLGVNVISCDPEVYRLCNDKYLSMQFLREKGINAPDTTLCRTDGEVETFLQRNVFPVFLKPRFGASSADTFKIKNKEQLFGILNAFNREHFVAQCYLADQRDFTVGTYISRDRNFQETLIIERELKFGLSYRGEVIENNKISKHCLAIAAATGAKYSINVQLKLVDGVPFTYEINPRLSSTTCVRAHFGFNEPDMILSDLFGDMASYRLTRKKGVFTRYWQEHYLEVA